MEDKITSTKHDVRVAVSVLAAIADIGVSSLLISLPVKSGK